MGIFKGREKPRENPLEDRLDGLKVFTYPDRTTIQMGDRVTLAGGDPGDVRVITGIIGNGDFSLLKVNERDEVVGGGGPYRLGDINLPGTGNRGIENGHWGEVEIYIGMPVKLKNAVGVFEDGWVTTGESATATGRVVLFHPDGQRKIEVSTTDLKQWQVEAVRSRKK